MKNKIILHFLYLYYVFLLSDSFAQLFYIFFDLFIDFRNILDGITGIHNR